jgi:multisubunit Na+/H+ antiporter MnhF subunit
MNVWLITAFVLLLCLIPPFVLCIRGDAANRLVGLEAGSTIASIILLVLAVGYNRVPFVDIALTLALLSFGAGLVFTRFLERWL